ncbi:PQ-loop repeat-containing protein 2 [Gaeumannomyces tritici R3-111a-1]|uniref:PQ-loop repeat-containing protein 2 n=1 Tax=Gaeumannomyces tritici (strain R3-111a-1) TaxID=644352 RepID=J3NL18_GAET3|nr:PQ-loop repeat-containing protein 2 [Gaeumannomyces tritici R3-111a-1]EJT81985.1 PQ-loop repeat-containing protein 2 [Gaeumannomyces tritici R3-111a-1]
MAPPTGPLNLDVEAISGICGSISIACWVVVFSPQIVENFRRSSADGLSLQFIIIWLAGDVFNILGAVLQGVLPTMIILAVYYTIADIVLLGQCFYYRGFTFRDEAVPSAPKPRKSLSASNGHATNDQIGEPNERTGLLTREPDRRRPSAGNAGLAEHRRGSWSNNSHHLSPVVPLLDESAFVRDTALPTPASRSPARGSTASKLQAAGFNLLAVLMVCTAGVAGWYMSRPRPSHRGEDAQPPSPPSTGDDVLEFSFWGQIFGWLCAVLYLGSRVPQILLNWRRKSTEGVSMLFFLFACLGNLTYVLSIFAFEPSCHVRGSAASGCAPGEAAHAYWQYILVNLSWLAGSLGTLLLDMGIFVQFFLYNKEEEDDDYDDDFLDDEDTAVSDADGESIDGERWDSRPILQRSMSNYSH